VLICVLGMVGGGDRNFFVRKGGASQKRLGNTVLTFSFQGHKKNSLDKNLNILKHVFINFIFTKLDFLCMAHLIMH